MELRWIASHSASALHAALALLRGRALRDARLAAAVREPAERLQEEILAWGLPEDRFWQHLVPLSAGIENNRELAEVTLRKTIGAGRVSEAATTALSHRIGDVESAVRSLFPGLASTLAHQGEHLRADWLAHGPGLLYGVGRLTDERLIVPRADVILVHPAIGGAGVAHLLYNSVRMEPVGGDPLPELPEVARLGWLLAQLNIDLPIFSERIRLDRHRRIAAWSMLPPVLAAAQEMNLAVCDLPTLGRAIDSWLPDGCRQTELGEVVLNWWETYLPAPPPWHVALAALDQMLDEAWNEHAAAGP